jgi:hypothetical protein
MSSFVARLDTAVSMITGTRSREANRIDQFDAAAIKENLCCHSHVEENLSRRTCLDDVFQSNCACFPLIQGSGQIRETNQVDCTYRSGVNDYPVGVRKKVQRWLVV